MPDYRYVIRSNIGGTIRGELAAYGVTFDYALSGYGSVSFRVAMDDPIGDPFGWTIPMCFNINIERDGVLVYHGLIWQRQLDYQSREITVSGNEWGSIYDKQITLDADFVSTTPHDIVNFLMLASGTLTLGAPHFIGGGGGMENVVDASWSEASHVTIMSAIDQLAKADTNGFEYRWLASYDGSGNVVRQMQAGSPLLPGLVTLVPDLMAPGGGATVQSITQDQRDRPNHIRAYSSDGYLVHTRDLVAGVTDGAPLDSYAAWNFSTDLTDSQITDVSDARFLETVVGDNAHPYLETTTVTIIAPAMLTDYGAEGDVLTLVVQPRADLFGGDGQIPGLKRLVGRTVKIDSKTGMETLELKLIPSRYVP